MSRLHTAARVVLGTVLLLHGLANSVLPLRGIGSFASGWWPLSMTLLDIFAIVGFVIAGLGVLGVRPLARETLPAALVAGIAGLVVQLWRADTDLWLGVLLSASLPVLTVLYVGSVQSASTAPSPLSTPARRVWGRAGDALGIALLLWVTASAALWPWHRTWGTTPQEWLTPLPGDHSPRTPSLEILHGVTIEAPPQEVWPWLVQIGQDRAGFYSYTWLERAFGARITNASSVHREWQDLRAGDQVFATQQGYLGGIFGNRPGWVVDRVEPGRALVLRNWGAFVLQPVQSGGTRLLIRSTISNEHIPAWLAAINFTAFQLPHFIMQRRMMLGIKERAERTTRD